jgi:hypothetical protein
MQIGNSILDACAGAHIHFDVYYQKSHVNGDYNTDLWAHVLHYPQGFGCICISNFENRLVD